MVSKRREEQGFTLLELLVVVGIIGILAAIAISNYYNAAHRAKQKRTMADIRSVALAWESRAIDVKTYNAAAAGFSMPAAVLTYSDVVNLLTPTYIGILPRVDGWNNPLDFRLDYPIGGAKADIYAIRSGARDGVYQGSNYAPGPTTNFDCDIVYSGGAFVVWPEGVQQK